MKTILYSALILTCCFLNAQNKKFKYGQIVHKNGSVEQGYIKESNYEVQFLKIEFRNKAGNVVELNPDDIKGYSINGKKFVSGQLQYQDNPQSISFFFEQLTSGSHELIKLYISSSTTLAMPHYLKNEDTHYFIRTKSEQIQLSRGIYKSQINDLLNCQKDVSEGIYDYTSQGITSYLLAKEKTCDNIDINQEIKLKSRKGIESYGFGSGVIWSTINPKHPHFENVEMMNEPGLYLMAYLQVPLYKTLYLRGGLNYFNKKTIGSENVIVNEFYENEGEEINLKTDIDFRFIGAFADIKYEVQTKFIKPYFFAGTHFGISTSNKVSTEEIILSNENGDAFQRKRTAMIYETEPHRYDVGLKYGVGISFRVKKVDIYTEIELTNSNYPAKSANLEFDSKSKIFTVGIQIN